MGYSATWVAIKGKPIDEVLAILKLRPTGEKDEFPESRFNGRLLPSGYYLVWSDKFDENLISNDTLKQLSFGATAIACAIEEHVMFSSAAEWMDSTLNWSIVHDAQDENRDLVTTGTMPRGFEEVRAHYLKKQSERKSGKLAVDYIFEIPLVVAQKITSFKHDEVVEGDVDGSYEVLESLFPPPKSFLRRLLGL